MAGETILVLVGTTKGRATTVAEALRAALVERGLRAETSALDRVEAGAIAAADALVVCTSTFGSGGVPANAVGFLDRLESGDVACAGKPVGFVGLGDRSFRDTYNGGWQTLARAFAGRGAVAVGEPLLFDAAEALPPDEAARRLTERVTVWAGAFQAALDGWAGRRRG